MIEVGLQSDSMATALIGMCHVRGVAIGMPVKTGEKRCFKRLCVHVMSMPHTQPHLLSLPHTFGRVFA
jgi:hypothetical protein